MANNFTHYLLRMAADFAQRKRIVNRSKKTLDTKDINVYPDFSNTTQAAKVTTKIPAVKFLCLHNITSAAVDLKAQD